MMGTPQPCPTRGEPEREVRFQRKVSPKSACRGSSGDDRDTSDRTHSDNRAGRRLRRGERACGVPTPGPGRRPRLRGADAGAARLPRPGQALEGAGEALPGQDHGLLARPAHAADPPAPRDGQGGRPPGREPGSALRARLHAGRRPTRDGWPGWTRTSARCPGSRRGSCCTASTMSSATRATSPRRDLGQPHLQPAGFPDLPGAAHGGRGDEGDGGGGGRPPGTAAGRPARLPARRHRARVDFVHVGRPRRHQRRVPGQRGRRGHAVRVRRRGRGDLRTLSGAGARRSARPVPVHGRRLPRRQRVA